MCQSPNSQDPRAAAQAQASQLFRTASSAGPAARASVAGGMGTQNDRLSQAQYPQEAAAMNRFMMGSGQMPDISLQRYAGPIMGGGQPQAPAPVEPVPGMGRAAAMTGPAARASVAGGMGTQNDRAMQAQYQQAPAIPGVAAGPTAVDESMFPSSPTPGGGGGGGGGVLGLVQQLARGLSSLPRAPLNPAPYAGETGPDPTRYEDSMFPPSQTTGLPPGMVPMPFNPAAARGMTAQTMPNTPTSGQGMVVQPMGQPGGGFPPPPPMPQPQDLLVNQGVDPLRAAINRLPMPQMPGQRQSLADPRNAFVPQPPTRPAGLGAPVPQPPVRPATMHDPAFNPGPGGDDGGTTMMRDINMLARERGLPPVFTI